MITCFFNSRCLMINHCSCYEIRNYDNRNNNIKYIMICSNNTHSIEYTINIDCKMNINNYEHQYLIFMNISG